MSEPRAVDGSPGARFELDASVRRSDAGRLLAGGMPSRMVRLSDEGAQALDRTLAGQRLDERAGELAARLEASGLIHPLPPAADEVPVTTVIPVRNGGPNLARLVAALVGVARGGGGGGEVIVVDDGSGDGSADYAAAAGAQVLVNAGAPGPAGARNTGLAAATTDFVAFLDADCAVSPTWRAGLATMLAADPSLALAAPRVRSAPGPGVLARYEALHSPLDLGPSPSLVGPGRRVSYLPAAALVGRRSDLLAIGGFDERMRFGEDVDLVWRLLAAGRRARYVPAREVLHAPRPSLAGLARQRFGYGGSAPALDRRHPGAAAPLRAGRHTTAVWLAGATLGTRSLFPGATASDARGVCGLLAGADASAARGVGALLVAATVSAALAASRGSDGPARLALAGVALRGHIASTHHLSRAVSREWLPLALAAAALDRRARRLLLAAIAIDALAGPGSGAGHLGPTRAGPSAGRLDRGARACLGAPRLDPARTIALRAVDNAAYSAGLWHAALAARDLGALVPRSS